MQEEAKRLADDHWDNFVGPLLEIFGGDPVKIHAGKVFYKKGMIDGFMSERALNSYEILYGANKINPNPTETDFFCYKMAFIHGKKHRGQMLTDSVKPSLLDTIQLDQMEQDIAPKSDNILEESDHR